MIFSSNQVIRITTANGEKCTAAFKFHKAFTKINLVMLWSTVENYEHQRELFEENGRKIGKCRGRNVLKQVMQSHFDHKGLKEILFIDLCKCGINRVVRGWKEIYNSIIRT